MNYLVIIFSFLFVFLFSQTFADNNDFFQKGLAAFKNQEFEKAEIYFSKIKPDQNIYPYAFYYMITIKEVLDENLPKIKNLENFKDLSIYSYINMKLASLYLNKGQVTTAENFLKNINLNKLDKKDIPFYLFLKSEILEKKNKKTESFKIKKKLATQYTQDRFYGFRTFLKIKDKLNKWDRYEAIQTLINDRKFETALSLLYDLPNEERKKYFNVYILAKLKRFEEAEEKFKNISQNSKYYSKAAYILSKTYIKDYIKQKKYFTYVSDKSYKEKLADYLMKRAFFKNDYYSFFYYSLFIKPKSKFYGDKVWFKFLYYYKFGDYKNAYSFLKKNKRYIFDKFRYYYWMYKLSKKVNKEKESVAYLNKIKNSEGRVTFYKILALEKLNLTDKQMIKNLALDLNKLEEKKKLNTQLKLIDYLKQNEYMYKWAYLEGKHYKNLKELYPVMPELTPRLYITNKKFYVRSYPKPFGTGFYENRFLKEKFESLVYGVIRQESLFNPYSLGYSNDVGLMQFIPSTAKWVAKNLGIKDFDMYDMFKPSINIRFGRWYLNYLLDYWNGKLYYAIASYNAGEKAVKRFLDKNNAYGYTIEEFAEFFPYEVTRGYIKRVYRNFVVYNLIYGKK